MLGTKKTLKKLEDVSIPVEDRLDALKRQITINYTTYRILSLVPVALFGALLGYIGFDYITSGMTVPTEVPLYVATGVMVLVRVQGSIPEWYRTKLVEKLILPLEFATFQMAIHTKKEMDMKK